MGKFQRIWMARALTVAFTITSVIGTIVNAADPLAQWVTVSANESKIQFVHPNFDAHEAHFEARIGKIEVPIGNKGRVRVLNGEEHVASWVESGTGRFVGYIYFFGIKNPHYGSSRSKPDTEGYIKSNFPNAILIGKNIRDDSSLGQFIYREFRDAGRQCVFMHLLLKGKRSDTVTAWFFLSDQVTQSQATSLFLEYFDEISIERHVGTPKADPEKSNQERGSIPQPSKRD